MIPTNLRTMTPRDVEPATEALLAGDWGDRRTFFEFVTAHGACHPVVAERDGAIVGTGVGTVNGPVGWIGTIFVSPSERGRGVGRALTEAVRAQLAAVGCRTEVLVATDAGRRLYEKLGFDMDCWYRTVEAPGLGPTTGPAPVDGPRIRPFVPDDLDAMATLDARASGEDRRHLLASFATAESAQCLERSDGTLGGFVVRAPWGGGATVAPDPDDAMTILEARRRSRGPEARVRAGVLDVNVEGLARLERAGWTEAWRAVRMIRGAPLDWRPDHLWGQFNHALG